MRLEARDVACLTCLGLGVGAVTYWILSKMEKRRERKAVEEGRVSLWDMYLEERGRYSDAFDEEVDVETDDDTDEPDIPVVKRVSEEVPEEVHSSWKVVNDAKPSLEEMAEKFRNTVDDDAVEEPHEEEVMETEVVERSDKPVTRGYNVKPIFWQPDGTPSFTDEEWESEGDDIMLISQSEYLNTFLNYDKEQAVWFALSMVLVDTTLNPMEVVDTVGPTAFTALIKGGSDTVFVRNRELETDYELFVNDGVTIEEAWEEQGIGFEE